MGNSESSPYEEEFLEDGWLRSIQEKCGYTFKNLSLLRQALTHDSMRATSPNIPTYQRLEWLGDSVIQLVITDYLFHKYPCWNEGELSIKRSELVSARYLSGIANRLFLPSIVWMDYSICRQSLSYQFKGYHKFVESLIGAIYEDVGGDNYGERLEPVRRSVFRLWGLQNPNPSQSEEALVKQERYDECLRARAIVLRNIIRWILEISFIVIIGSFCVVSFLFILACLMRLVAPAVSK